jgi:HK97 family phage portal protein
MKIPWLNIEIRTAKRPRPDDWDDFWYTHMAGATLSGLDINEATALTYSAVWACVRVISEDIASLPLHLYRRDSRGKERAQDQPLYYLLHDAPNSEMTAMQFRECMMGHLLTWGNAYAQIVRNLRGDILALWPMDPSRMKVTRSGNELVYEYRLENGQKEYFRRDEMFHIPGLGYNGITGYSPISMHREAIACGLSAQNMQADMYKNGAFPSIAISHPAPKAPTPEGRENFRKKLQEEYSGVGNRGKILTLWEGMKAEKLSMSLEDAQFIESRKFLRSEIAAIYRVPPHKIMDLDKATFSNIEEQSLSYVTDAIRPWCVRWEQAINLRLLNGSGKFFAEHLLDGLLRGNIEDRYSAYSMGRQWGWFSINDIREKENMNPIADGDGYLQPLNMGVLGEAPAASEEPVTEEEKEQAARTIRYLKLVSGKHQPAKQSGKEDDNAS